MKRTPSLSVTNAFVLQLQF